MTARRGRPGPKADAVEAEAELRALQRHSLEVADPEADK
jgi:hypothetical protein